MGTAATRPRHNRTITVDFHDEATYFQLLDDGKAFVEWVLAFILTLGFQLRHQTTCHGGGCLTRHAHYIRVRLGRVIIWRLQCMRCKAVFTVLPHFVLRYRQMRPEVARDALLATHGGLSLELCAVIHHLSPMALYRLVCAFGRQSLVTVLTRCGLPLPVYFLADEKHTHCLTDREMQLRIGRDVPFVATIHNGHAKTDLRHIHAICLVQGRLSKAEYARLMTLWQIATEEVKRQRRARDRVRERERTQFLTQARVVYQYTPSKARYLSQVDAPRKRYRRIKPLQLQHGCNSCGYGHLGGLPSWYHLCPCCHKPLTQEKTLQLELSRQL
jgi:hypothetical protein